MNSAVHKSDVLSLRIELEGIEPLIWRRVWVPASLLLPRLHRVIQSSMGWSSYHLHEFHCGQNCYALKGVHELPEGTVDARDVELAAMLGGAREFMYLYDLRDGWRHRVVLEASEQPRPRWQYPVCVAGANACPPEGIGGPMAYLEFLLALARNDDSYQHSGVHLTTGFFDPSGFDANHANLRMHKIRI